MKIKIHSQNDRRTSTWAGGITNELWIMPNESNYASRNFQARISSATVNLQESDFTSLPNIVRYITPLSGSFVLSHPDGRSVKMLPLDAPYRFDGGVATHCSGTATDFNLMLKGVEGKMEIIRGQKTFDGGICCVYPINGVGLKVNGEPIDIAVGDLVEIRPQPDEKVTLETPEAILCEIFISGKAAKGSL